MGPDLQRPQTTPPRQRIYSLPTINTTKPNHLQTTQYQRNNTTKHPTHANHMDRRTPQQPCTRRSNLCRCRNQNTQKLRTLPTRHNLDREIPQPPPQSTRGRARWTCHNPLKQQLNLAKCETYLFAAPA